MDGVRKAINQLVGAGVAEFAANQALQIDVVRLQALGPRREFSVIGDQPVAGCCQLGPMIPQQDQVTRPQRSGDATDYQQREDDAED